MITLLDLVGFCFDRAEENYPVKISANREKQEELQSLFLITAYYILKS